jgi:RNA polymerase sigma factor (sigma-70 family)
VRKAVEAYQIASSDRDDCVQQVWFTLLRRLARFDYQPVRGRFRAWFFRVTRNEILHFARLASRCRRHEDCDLTMVADHRKSDPLVILEEISEKQFVHETLARIRQDIPDMTQRVLELRWIEGRDVSETAAALEITPEQVRVRQYRVKGRLKRLLQPLNR